LTKKRPAKKGFSAHVGPAAWNESAGRHAAPSRDLRFLFFFGFEIVGLLVEGFEFKFFVHNSTHFSASRLLIKGR
jgi:hypothetical protein